jgi:hypothetical protein
MAICSRFGLVLTLCIATAMVGIIGFTMIPEPMDVNADGAHTLGLRVPMPPLIRAVNWAGEFSAPHKLIRWVLPLDLESVKARAKALTGGLEDFGELVDMEAFRAFLAIIDERAHFVGRAQWWWKAPSMLASNLRITQIIRDHPEVLNQTIKQPIIIAGYVRSGSTWLQHIVAKTYGQSVRYVRFWESLSGGIELDPKQPGTMRKLGEGAMSAMRLFPSIFAMHEVNDVDQPEEELGWTELTSKSFLSVFEIESSYFDHLAVQPSSAHLRYRMLKVLMQIKQWEEGPQQWVLKSPEHLNGVHELAEAFPDARTVTIHRDEVTVYKSLLLLFHTTRSMTLPDVSVEQTKLAADVQICSQRRGLAAVPSLEMKSLALNFHDVIGQPIDTLKQFAAFTGLEWNATIEARAEAAVEAAALRKKRMGGKIVYQIYAFGLTETNIRERLEKCERYGSYEALSTTAAMATHTERKPFYVVVPATMSNEPNETFGNHIKINGNLTPHREHNWTFCHEPVDSLDASGLVAFM